MKRPLRLGEGMRDEQGWHATDCQPIVSRRSIRVRQIHRRVKTLRIVVGATGFEPTCADATAGRPATPCAQGKRTHTTGGSGRPLPLVFLRKFSTWGNCRKPRAATD